jgi:ubiquinone/menaquinone biosynthesis C-methylase UbiE
MNHADHVRLLAGGVSSRGGVWADLGSGSGAFTLALADLLGSDGEIYSVDRDAGALREQERALRTRFPAVRVHYITADYTRPLSLPPLDGIVMANSLHFLRDKEKVLRALKAYLRPCGQFILVEYDTDQGNMWVPHPLSFPTWQATARRAGFTATKLIATVPSRFLGRIYGAVSE